MQWGNIDGNLGQCIFPITYIRNYHVSTVLVTDDSDCTYHSCLPHSGFTTVGFTAKIGQYGLYPTLLTGMFHHYIAIGF